MADFQTKSLPKAADAIAPDGSELRVLLAIDDLASTAHFKLRPGQISKAVTHRTVHEIWYVLAGQGEIWRSMNGREETANLKAGECITLPLGTCFQFRASGSIPLEVLGVTIPPWPNTADEARVIDGKWTPNVT